MSTRRPLAYVPFLAIGIAFLALGASGKRAFLTLGIVFVAIAMGQAGRARRS